MAGIVNPVAGRGRAESLWDRVSAELRCFGFDPVTMRTTRRGDGSLLARSAAEMGIRTIAAVGGDGTVHEVVNGLQHDGRPRTDVRLAVIPAGTGVDFARNVGIRRGVAAAVRRLVSGQERLIDIGTTADGGRFFVNFAETGLGAAVVEREAEYSDSWPGRASFLLASLSAAIDERNLGARISVDRRTVLDGPVVSVIAANGQYFAGGMRIAPKASMADGLLDVLILGDFTRFELISQIWKIYPGIHLAHKKVLWLQGRVVEIEHSKPTRLDLDGELGGDGPYTLSILENALRVLI